MAGFRGGDGEAAGGIACGVGWAEERGDCRDGPECQAAVGRGGGTACGVRVWEREPCDCAVRSKAGASGSGRNSSAGGMCGGGGVHDDAAARGASGGRGDVMLPSPPRLALEKKY